MPGLTVSLSRMTPRTRGGSPPRWSVTTSGVAPSRETCSTSGPSSSGTVPPASATIRRTVSAAPLRTDRAGMPSAAGKSIPLIRVWAVNGTIVGVPARTARRGRSRAMANSTIERPSGVSSARLDASAASASSSSVTSWTGSSSAAWRAPNVIVPVLSSSSVVTSPAASTARPDIASTLRCTRRSMPAMPIADSSPPIVVGIRHTSRATSTMIGCSALQ